MNMMAKQKGFTIVELLVVIVVIAILAAISVIAYNGVQAKGKDTQRLSDMNQLTQAVEMYRVQFGVFPPYQALPADQAVAGWEVSTRTAGFLNPLKESGVISSQVPNDPDNIKVAATISSNSDNFLYFYHRYSAGGSCDPSLGSHYVLGVTRMSTVTKGANHPDSPGFSCPSGATWVGRDWSASGAWVTGGFLQ